MAFSKLTRFGSRGIQKTLGTPIAVDFGTAALKVLQVSADEAPSLVAAGCVVTPDDLLADPKGRLEFQFERLPGLIGDMPLRGKRAVCGIPAPLTFCKHAQFGRQEGLTPDILADTMLSEQLGRDASTIVKRMVEVDENDRAGSGTKAEYICLATGRDIIERLMKALKNAKLEPVGMHSEYEALGRACNAFSGGAKPDPQRATLYLDIGCRQTRAIILHGERLVFARAIDVGGNSLDERIASQTGCTLEAARQRRRAMARLTEPAPQPVGAPVSGQDADAPSDAECLHEPLEILTDEVGMCLRYHDSMYRTIRCGGVVFVGGESLHRGLCQHIARTLRLPAQVADPLARIKRTGDEKLVGIDLSTPQPGWAVPVGLAASPTDL